MQTAIEEGYSAIYGNPPVMKYPWSGEAILSTFVRSEEAAGSPWFNLLCETRIGPSGSVLRHETRGIEEA